MRHFLQIVLVGLVSAIGACAFSDTASAQTVAPELAASIRNNDTLKPVVSLKNQSDRACQVATTAEGTVAITKVMQDGQLIKPASGDAAGDEDIGYLLQRKLKTLAPGESVDVPLMMHELKAGPVLRSLTWSRDGGTYSAEYAVRSGHPIEMELSYNLPITPNEGAPACGAAFASTFDNRQAIFWRGMAIGAVVLAIIFVLVILLLLYKNRTHRTKALSAIVLTLGTGILGIFFAPQAYAGIVVPPAIQADFDSCMATLDANRDITGPVLDVINNPANQVEIVETTGGSDMTARRGPDGGLIFTIYWNPNDRHPYAGTGGNADPCTSLYHEMSHARDVSDGTFSRAECAGSGIETKEVMATRAQNELRVRLGMPPRSHYGDRPLPSGDCSESADPARCTGEHCGDTNGDPHLRTFDGLRYDFQAVGEFIAARDKSGNYEIQVRQTPWEGSRIVSLNTAIAAKIAGDRVEIRSGKTMELVVNGETVPLEKKTLPGGGAITLERNVVVLSWPDGSKSYVRSVGSYGLALSVQPSESLTGKLEGLLGDANGNSDNDLQVRGSSGNIKPTHEELYPKFADSWRITDATSLFDYGPGKNTSSYTDRSYPDKAEDPKKMPGYAAAEVFCKSMGISDPAVLANCALDVAITGRPEFARAALHSQEFSSSAKYGGTTWRLSVKKPHDSAFATFSARKGEKIFVDVLGSTLPSQCGVLTLIAPDGREISSGCIINGRGEIDGIVLPQTGKYTLKLTPSRKAGSATIRLLRIADYHGKIVADGASVTARIDRPGEVARYTFEGAVGQRVYLHVPNSSLESQCSPLGLLAPGGNEIASGCIINGRGEINTVVLPKSGRYTVVVDPRSAATGNVQMQLIQTTNETRPLAMNGPSLSVNLVKPGSSAEFTFRGVAGQRIFVDIPSSTLPSRCGILDLYGPNDKVLTSGCIINGSGGLGRSGYILPDTGMYKLVLDPNAADTGIAEIRLRSR